MLFHFPKAWGAFAPLPATPGLTAWISYSAKVPPAKAGSGPGKASSKLGNRYPLLHLPHAAALTCVISLIINNGSIQNSWSDTQTCCKVYVLCC